MALKNNKVLVYAHIFHFQFRFRLEITLLDKEFGEKTDPLGKTPRIQGNTSKTKEKIYAIKTNSEKKLF